MLVGEEDCEGDVCVVAEITRPSGRRGCDGPRRGGQGNEVVKRSNDREDAGWPGR